MNSTGEPTLQRSGSIRFNLGLVAVIFVMLMVFIMGLIKIYSPDLGFHLRSAEWMLDHKQFIYIDSFSYGSDGHKYFDLQWFYQLIIYFLYNRGESMLIIVNAFLITCSVLLIFTRYLKNTTTYNTNGQLAIFALMALLFVQPLSFEIRPHVFSWLYLNLLLFSLEAYKRGKNKTVLFLPFIILFWVNTHSLAILGLVTIGIYNAGIYFETKKIDRRLLLFSGLSIAAFLLNPYFFEGLLFPLKQFGFISGEGLFKSYIGEMQSPFTTKEIELMGKYYFRSPLLFIHISALVCLFSIFRSLKQKQFTDTLLLVAYLFLLNLGHKNFGYYLVVTLPLMVKYSLDWLENKKKKTFNQKTPAINKGKNKPKVEPAVNTSTSFNQKLYRRVFIITIFLAVLISITCITDGYPIYRQSPYRFGFTTDNSQLPVEATNFLIRNKIRGKLLNQLDYGGYLMAHYTEKVFIDGRIELMNEDFFEKYYRSVTQKNGMKDLVNEFDPDIVIFPYLKATNWWAYFLSQKNRSGYKPVYFDGLSVIYLKSSSFSQIPGLTEKDILKTMDRTALQRITDHIANSSKPKGMGVLLTGIWKKQTMSAEDENKATYCFTNGYDTAALIYSVMGIERSTVHTPNIYKNLSIYYQEKKMYSEAQLCEEKSE